MIPQRNTRYPAGYWRLGIGTEYVNMSGIAVPVSELVGERQNNILYIAGEGRLIQRRKPTAADVYATHPVPRTAEGGSVHIVDIDDWNGGAR